MSIDLAVWEGPEPASDEEAAATFEDLYNRYIETEAGTPPTERIAAYVRTLLARYPDLTELDDEAVDECPWAAGPLMDEASGPFLYFAMTRNEAAKEAWEYAVGSARAAGLVCFDPQSERLAK
jgi:hypothetical protein